MRFLLVLMLALGAWSCGTENDNQGCDTTENCDEGERCVEDVADGHGNTPSSKKKN